MKRSEEFQSLSTPSRGLAGIVQRAARASGRRPKTAIALWLLLIAGLIAAGSMTGTKELSSTDAGVGQSGERVAEVRTFVDAVERVAEGGTVLDREVVSQLVRASEPAGSDAGIASLTPKEREVLELMAEGRTNAGIAKSMVVTQGAVEKHISSIFGKLDLPQGGDDHRRVLAVLTYLRATSEG